METPTVRQAYRKNRGPGSDPRRDGVPDPGDDTEEKDEQALLCGACGATITSARHAAEINGGHRHTFFNPHGVLYEIRCFAAAPGCADLGEATDEFSWFPGYAWRVSVCGECGAHLGWQFLGDGASVFWGLVQDRLTET